jgi:hypothetical protein
MASRESRSIYPDVNEIACRRGEPNAISNAIGWARFYGGSHDAVIRVYDDADNVIETHEQAGEFKSRSTLVTAGFRWHNSRS